MDAVNIVKLPFNESLLHRNIPEISDSSNEKCKETFCNNESDKDDILLRFSDEEEISACSNNQTNFQPKQNDLEIDVQAATSAEVTSKPEKEKLTNSQNLTDKENIVLIKVPRNSKICSLKSKFADASCGVGRKESIMSGSDRLGMYNGSKHWNFNKGWKGMNSSRGYSHRGGGDWYKQPYSDKDKYSKTHYHNQSKFRLHNTPRSMFQSGPLDKNRVSKKDNVKLAQKLKHSLSTSEISKEKKQLVKENGLLHGLRPGTSSIQKNKSIEDAKNSLNSIKIVNVTSEHKENISSVKSSSEQKNKDSTSDVLRIKRDKIVRDNPSTVTKECEVVELDDDDDNSDSQESRCNYNGIVQKVIDDDDDADCIITEEMIPQKRCVISEVTSEMQIKIVDVATSKEDVMDEDNNETVMEVDDSSSQSGCEIDEQCDEAGPSVVQLVNTFETASNLQCIEAMHENDNSSSEILLSEDINEENKEESEQIAEEIVEQEDEKVEEKEQEKVEEEIDQPDIIERVEEVAAEVAQSTEESMVCEEHEEPDRIDNIGEKENEETTYAEDMNNEEETNKDENIVQGEINVPDEKDSEEKVAEVTDSEEKLPEEKALEEKLPEEKALEEKLPEEDTLKENLVEEKAIEDKVPEEKDLEEKVPKEKEPEETNSEEKVPEEKDLEEKVPEEEDLEETVSEEKDLEEKVPEEKDQEKNLPEEKDSEEKELINEAETMEISITDENEERIEKAKEVSGIDELQDNETEDIENQEGVEEKTDDAAVQETEEVSEAMDVQSDVGSPKPLMIDETASTESNDARPDDKNDDTTPPKTPDNTEQPTASPAETVKDLKNEEEKVKDNKEEEKDEEKSSAGEVPEKDSNIVEELDIVEDDNATESPKSKDGYADKTKDDNVENTSICSNDTSSILPIGELEEMKTSGTNENVPAIVHKKRRKKRDDLEIPGFEIQEKGVRQKRRSARKAEDIIRKEILKGDEDEDDSSDESNKIAAYNNHKKQQQQPSTSLNLPRSLSPSSLKRSFQELDNAVESNTTKRLRAEEAAASAAAEKKEQSKENKVDLKGLVRDISQEDIKKKLTSLTSKEIEALLLQKIVECITIRGEMGKLREQARASKRTQEATRAKCQQLQKQVEGFEMVLKRITYDKTLNQDKYVQPIKINRSVGLQVNFQSDHGIQNLKQIQAFRANASATRAAAATASTSTVSSPVYDNHVSSPKKIIKIRSPRKPEMSVVSMVSQTSTGNSTICSTPMTTITGTTAQITSKLLEASNKRPITLQNAGNIMQILQPSSQQQHQQTLIVNRTIQKPTQTVSANNGNTNNSSVTTNNNSNDLIDLTDEEDKNKSKFAVGQTTRQIPAPSVQPVNNTAISRVPTRVFQAVTTSGVPLSSATNLRLVTTNSQSSPTAIVNTLNGQKVTYGTVVMNGNKQLLLTSNQIRQVSSVQGKNITTLYNKQGLPTLANGQTLRVLQPTTTLQAQVLRHPASLPENTTPVVSNPNWKLPPPAPSLKISKVATGIVLSWNMNLTDKFANIASYQLFAYQEVAGTAPSPNIWKKIGDVRSLPLPMACTLTQFTEGNNYHFAVRAVDEHSRFGHYSKPGNISL